MQPIPVITQEDVNRVVLREFGADGAETALAVLNKYGVAPYHRETSRVHMAILKLSAGDHKRLQQYTNMACTDYRDVLAYAEYPAYFVEVPPSGKASEEMLKRVIAADAKQYANWLQVGHQNKAKEE